MVTTYKSCLIDTEKGVIPEGVIGKIGEILCKKIYYSTALIIFGINNVITY